MRLHATRALALLLVFARSSHGSRSAAALHRLRGGSINPKLPITSAPITGFQQSSSSTWPHQQQQPPPQQQQAQLPSLYQQQQPAQSEAQGERMITDMKQRDSRLGLIRKVYSVLSLQLFVTAGSVLAFSSHPELARFFERPLGSAVLGLCVAATMACSIALHMNTALRRHNGKASAVLGGFTLAEALVLGVVCSRYKLSSVVLCLGQTGAAVAGLSAYAFQPNPNRDLTVLGSTLGSAAMVLVATGIAAMFLRLPGLNLAYSAAGAVLFSFFIVYDTQRIVGGDHRRGRSLDPRDWAIGALALYLDIINLFLFMLRLVAEER